MSGQLAFWTAMVSLAAATVTVVGPPIARAVVRRLEPEQLSTSDIARESTAAVHESLRTMQADLTRTVGAIQLVATENSGKLDRILDRLARTHPAGWTR